MGLMNKLFDGNEEKDIFEDNGKQFEDQYYESTKDLKEDDILMITADHGCDPSTPSTDHSREYVPLIMAGPHIKAGTNLGPRKSFADIGRTVLDYFGLKNGIAGESFLGEILR